MQCSRVTMLKCGILRCQLSRSESLSGALEIVAEIITKNSVVLTTQLLTVTRPAWRRVHQKRLQYLEHFLVLASG